MSIAEAFFVLMFWLGILAVGYFTVEFIRRHVHWRRVARRNRQRGYIRVGHPVRDERDWQRRFKEDLH